MLSIQEFIALASWFGFDIGEFLLEPLIYILLGIIVVFLFELLKKRTNLLFRILPLKVRRLQLSSSIIKLDKITVTYGLIPPESVNLPYYMVEEGDVTALYTLVSLLGNLYGRKNIEIENHRDVQSELQKISNLVTMSGPVWNEVTELYIGLSGSPVVFQYDENNDLRLVILNENGDEKLLTTEYTGKHRPKKCYGILMGSKVNLYGTMQHIVLLAGNSNLSTYASALLLSAIQKDKDIKQELAKYKLWKEKRWLLIFSVENWVEGVNWYSDIPPIKIGVLRLAIKRVFKEKDFLEPYEYHLEGPETTTSDASVEE